MLEILPRIERGAKISSTGEVCKKQRNMKLIC